MQVFNKHNGISRQSQNQKVSGSNLTDVPSRKSWGNLITCSWWPSGQISNSLIIGNSWVSLLPCSWPKFGLGQPRNSWKGFNIDFDTVEPLNSGHLRVLKNLSVIEGYPLLGDNLTYTVIFGTEHFVGYSRHVRYWEVSLYFKLVHVKKI